MTLIEIIYTIILVVGLFSGAWLYEYFWDKHEFDRADKIASNGYFLLLIWMVLGGIICFLHI